MARIIRRRIPDLVQAVLTESQKFSIHQALRILETQWLENSVEINSENIQLRPAADLSFPVADIRRSSIDSYGKVSLELNFMGLFGVDSPLPLYFSQLAAYDTEQAKRIRGLLSVINHKIYVYHYLAWRQHNYLVRSEQNEKNYYQLLSDLSGLPSDENNLSSLRYAGMFLSPKRSAANLKNMLSHYLQNSPVQIKKFTTTEVRITQSIPLGKQLHLNKNSFIGEKLLLANRCFNIIVGPLEWLKAKKYFIIQQGRHQLGMLIKQFIPVGMRCLITVDCQLSSSYRAVLGAENMQLNWHTVLGKPLKKSYAVNLSLESLLL